MQITNNKNLFIITILTCLMLMPAYFSRTFAQEQKKQKIPYEVVEDPASDNSINESSAPHRTHRMALGVTIDPFPTVLSAVDRVFGLCVQPWFSVDNFKIRLDIARFRIPDDCVATRYFHRNNVNAFSLVFEYAFGANADGFLVGAGIGMWQDSVGHRYFNQSATAVRPFLLIEGGYIWKFHKNLYIEPCLALDVMLTRPKLSVYRFGYTPLPLAGEITLKFGMFIDI